ncbi:DUF885 domain-containing protein [Mangrovimicrobium sediminis]|uniref:DUF885 domain-containing protein n=1 Tax=Mangrovimicrobium sediminis TaxID=2562682 RepID=A0A4Z0LV46_9GAMM|nr:DUF885 domain-containing protein [Haliea sp. SAOS-164]TGD70935.1 DUF885 domain-containing protein [Haliea sp. SAOS-164]
MLTSPHRAAARPLLSLAAALVTTLGLHATAQASTDGWTQRMQAESDINQLGRLYLELSLEEDPVTAATYGIHGRSDGDYYYDHHLPALSPQARAGFAAQRAALQAKLDALPVKSLSRSDQIDLHILKKRIAYDRMVIEELKQHEDPVALANQLGTAFSGLVLREYAPLDQRLLSFGARCEQTPDYLAGAQADFAPANVQPTEMAKAIALSSLQGMTAEGTLFDKTLPELLGDSGLDDKQRAAIRASCDEAVAAIDAFTGWFESTVVPRENSEWRLGKALYDRKYELQLDFPVGPDALLARAEQWLESESAKLVEIGRRIHDDYLAKELAAGTVSPAAQLDDQQVVRDIFTKLAEDRSSVDTLIEDSYALADSIIGFVEKKQLMDLPPASKLRIEQTPPHLSGVAVAMIATAPPFEPDLESVWFWDLDLLAGSEDYLKEYNRASLALVYIHEGVPGHFVQLEYSNRAERLIPKVFWNGAMVEGWATYITTQLVAQGYTVYPDEPWGQDIQKMVDAKMVLRSIINAIIDLRLQRTDYAEEDALKLMTERGFQEPSEAKGKLVRAKLSSVQLASYFAGQSAIEEILAEYRIQRGEKFSYKDFNERLVGAGSPPFFAIREFMLGNAPAAY